jgi:hypothetical protein
LFPAPAILQLPPGILLRSFWLCDPGPRWLSRYGIGPANGFYPPSDSCSSPGCRRDWLSPFLIGLAVLFLTAAVMPAAMLKSAFSTGLTVADIFGDGAQIVTAENPAEGIAGDSLADPDGPAPGQPDPGALLLPDVHPEAGPGDFSDGTGEESPSIRARLEALSGSHAVWMIAFSPWIWCLFSWHVPRVPKRRIRRVVRRV